MAERMTHRKDLEELMVLARAVVTAEAGQDVTILIDDGPAPVTPPRKPAGSPGSVPEANHSGPSP